MASSTRNSASNPSKWLSSVGREPFFRPEFTRIRDQHGRDFATFFCVKNTGARSRFLDARRRGTWACEIFHKGIFLAKSRPYPVVANLRICEFSARIWSTGCENFSKSGKRLLGEFANTYEAAREWDRPHSPQLRD